MTSNYHTPHALNAPLTSAGLNLPLSSLDSAITLLGGQQVNVKTYGAVGDGVADDLVAFNNAVAALPTLTINGVTGKMGTIFVPNGTYKLSNEWAVDAEAVHVELAPGAHIFTTAATTHGATIWFVRDTTLGVAVTPQNSWASIRGGTVSNSGSGTLDNAIGFTRTKFAVCEQVRIPLADRKAISAQAGVDHVRFLNNTIGTTKMGGITVESNIGDVHIVGNAIASAGAGMLDQDQAAGILVSATVTDAWVARNAIGACGSFGIRSTSTTRLRIEDNTLPNCPSNGISVTSAVGVEVVRNRIISGKFGIAISTSSGVILVDGNEITAGGTLANTYDAMYFDTCTSRPVIRSNVVLGTNHRYAEYGATMASYPVVSTGNQLKAGGTGVYGGSLALALVSDLVDGYPMFAGYGPVAGVALHVMQGTAAPTTGTWLRGDIVWNTAPAAGGTPGWVCTTAGTPGTWKAMANLAA